MPMYNLIEYIEYYKNYSNVNMPQSKSIKSKMKITGKTPADGITKDFEIIVSLKYLSNFWRTLEMSLINCEVNLILTWSKDCVITSSTGKGTFATTETKFYVPVVTFSTQDNAKLYSTIKIWF